MLFTNGIFWFLAFYCKFSIHCIYAHNSIQCNVGDECKGRFCIISNDKFSNLWSMQNVSFTKLEFVPWWNYTLLMSIIISCHIIQNFMLNSYFLLVEVYHSIYCLKMKWMTWSWRSLHEWHVSNMDEQHLGTNEWLMFGNHEWMSSTHICLHSSMFIYTWIHMIHYLFIYDLQYVNKEYTYILCIVS